MLVEGERMTLTKLANPWTTIGASLELPLLKCTEPELEQWHEAPATYVRHNRIWLMYSRCNTGPHYELMLAYCDGCSLLEAPQRGPCHYGSQSVVVLGFESVVHKLW